jgi:hypothetical protein
MIWFAASVVIQILCVIHVYNTGRNQMWGLVILFFSLLGCTAYFAFEIMPELIGPHSPRARQARAKAKANPLHLLRDAEAKLAMVDTAANQMALADAMASLGSHNDAARHYRLALERMNGSDPAIEAKLANVLFEGGSFAEALAVIERQPVPVAIGEADRQAFLKARILAEMGRNEEAIVLYEDIVTRLPGEEARCRYAALLLERGDRARARTMLEETISTSRLSGKTRRGGSDAMLDWAESELRALRETA